MRALRRIVVLAVLVAVIGIVRERLLGADQARTGHGQGFARS